jgi:imidazole glycerol-phosphate synthase subunit HisH
VRIAILDYDSGNQTSVRRALLHLGYQAEITKDPAVAVAADTVIFPGVGAAGSCMTALRGLGLADALATLVARGTPTLCVCVGMQLLLDASEEDGGTACLGLLPGDVRRFQPTNKAVKVPHMGWNPVRHQGDPLFAGIPDGTAFYFVHSYHCVPAAGVPVIATSDHGGTFCAGLRRGSLAAVQFHPEKSGRWGLRLLANFLAL